MKNCSDETIRELIVLATEAREKAYAPYSKLKVGAAALTSGGQMFAGCNIENAVNRLGVCAEQVTLADAHMGKDKDTDIVVVAIVADMEGTSMVPAKCELSKAYYRSLSRMTSQI